MIALTGASGFLGTHLTQALAAKKLPFRALVRYDSERVSKFSQLTKRFQYVDYNDTNSIRNSLKGCETIIHTLGIINANEKTLIHVNETITQRVVDAAKIEGCAKFIHISSVAAGMRHGPYGESKFRGELIVKNSGIPYTILRPAYIYGSGDENNTAMLIRTLKNWPLIPLLGGGSFKLQPVFVQDVVGIILQALDLPPQSSEFNVAGAAQITLRAMLMDLSEGLKVKRAFLPVPLKPVQFFVRLFLKICPNTKLPAKQILELDKHEAFDISKTKTVFNFNPITYPEGTKRMFEEISCAG